MAALKDVRNRAFRNPSVLVFHFDWICHFEPSPFYVIADLDQLFIIKMWKARSKENCAGPGLSSGLLIGFFQYRSALFVDVNRGKEFFELLHIGQRNFGGDH